MAFDFFEEPGLLLMANDGVNDGFVNSFFILAEKKVHKGHKGFKMADIDQVTLALVFGFGVTLV